MKRILIVSAIAVVVAAAWIFVSLARQEAVARFCRGNQSFRLERMIVVGQGRRAALTEPESLAYFVAAKKFETLGRNERGVSFEVAIYDSLGKLGTFDMMVSTNATMAKFTCLKTPFATEEHSHFLIDSNAPTKFSEMIHFLLSDSNSGKVWP